MGISRFFSRCMIGVEMLSIKEFSPIFDNLGVHDSWSQMLFQNFYTERIFMLFTKCSGDFVPVNHLPVFKYFKGQICLFQEVINFDYLNCPLRVRLLVDDTDLMLLSENSIPV